MFKVTSAEFKKILSKPGIYILSVILAIILILGVFIYQPVVFQDTSITLKGYTYADKYTYFMGSPGGDQKSLVDANLNNAILQVNNYRMLENSETITIKEKIDKDLLAFETALKDYKDTAVDNSSQDYINNVARPNLVNSINRLNQTITIAMTNASNGSYSLLTTEKNYKTYETTQKEIYEHFRVTKNKNQILSHCATYENNYKDKFYDSINNFIYPNVSNSFIDEYAKAKEDSKLSLVNARLNSIVIEIEANLNDHNAEPFIMDNLANEYINTANTYINLIKYELLSNAFSYISASETLDIMYIKNYSQYDSNSLLTRYTYLFENNESEADYAHPLTIGVTSNREINTYDYSYFVLRLFSFVIIIYAVMMACTSIVGEIKEGSMRYYAIRPISRTEILMGKFLAILILSIILLLFSSIISLIVGGVVYNFKSLDILTIFNGSVPVILHPISMLGIFLLSTIFEIIIYTAIAMLMSTLLKSDILSVTIMIMFYLINTLLPIFVVGANTWLAFYPFSHINFYSLFGSSVYALPSDFFNLILGAKIYIGTDIILTSIIVVLLILIPSILAIKIFKKKEL